MNMNRPWGSMSCIYRAMSKQVSRYLTIFMVTSLYPYVATYVLSFEVLSTFLSVPTMMHGVLIMDWYTFIVEVVFLANYTHSHWTIYLTVYM
jgi:hypothetical protein